MHSGKIDGAAGRQPFRELQINEGGNQRTSTRRTLWPEGSVWSLACAIELGLIKEAAPSPVKADQRGYSVPLKAAYETSTSRFPLPSKKDSAKPHRRRRRKRQTFASQSVRRRNLRKRNIDTTRIFLAERSISRNIKSRSRESSLDSFKNSSRRFFVDSSRKSRRVDDIWTKAEIAPNHLISETARLIETEDEGFGESMSSFEDDCEHKKRKSWYDDSISLKKSRDVTHDLSSRNEAEISYENSFETTSGKDDNTGDGNHDSPKCDVRSTDFEILHDAFLVSRRSDSFDSRNESDDEGKSELTSFDEVHNDDVTIDNFSHSSCRDSRERPKKEQLESSRSSTSIKDEKQKTDSAGSERNFYEVRRITRGLTKINKQMFVGKLVWGSCSGWWPALIVDADHVGMHPEPGKLWVHWIGETQISLLSEKSQIDVFSSSLELRLKSSPKQRSSCAKVHAVNATMQMIRERLGCNLTKPYYAWMVKNFPELEKLDEIKFYPYPRKIQAMLDDLKSKNAKTTEKYLSSMKDSSLETPKKTSMVAAEKSKEAPVNRDTDPAGLPLMEQKPGVIAWAKIAGHNWWPGMILDYRDCCMREPSFGCQWIMWYGDYQLSEIHHRSFLRFDEGITTMKDYVLQTKKHSFLNGILHAGKDYCMRLGCDTQDWILADVFRYFFKESHRTVDSLRAKISSKYTPLILEKLNELKKNADVDKKRQDDIKNSEALRSVTSGNLSLKDLCLRCLNGSSDGAEMEGHPFFEGSLCGECSEIWKPCMFVIGNDGKCFYCTICAGSGIVVMCDCQECPRVYCTACLKYLISPKIYDDILQKDPWECFFCKDTSLTHSKGLLIPRTDWKERIVRTFRTAARNIEGMPSPSNIREKRKIRVLSLFDGLSTGLLVLSQLGIAVEVYYASEIDKDALTVSSSHFGDRIVQLGDVRNITKQKIEEIAPIDLLIGGSPCNDLSLANPARRGLHDPRGTGILFFEYRRIMNLLVKVNKNRHLFWLYENVASMPSEYRREINKHLGQEPDIIDSADFSPQHRLRLYWHNLPIDPLALSFEEHQDVQDVLTPHCNRYALVKKIRTVTTKVNSLKQGKVGLKPILMKDESDSLWITELEEIFGFPRHYTDVKNLSATKRQRLIGKSWSVQTLTAIFRPLRNFFERSDE